MIDKAKLSEKHGLKKDNHNWKVVPGLHCFFYAAIVALLILLIISTLVAQNAPLASNKESVIDSISSAVQSSSGRLSQDSSQSLLKEILKTVEQQTTFTRSSKYLYLLSAAAQLLASIMALVFTVTFIVAQLTTRYGMHMAARTLRFSRLLMIFVFTVLPILPLAGLLTDDARIAFWGVPFSFACVLTLVLYLSRFKRELQIAGVVDELRKKATNKLRSGNVVDVNPIVQKIEDIAYGAISQTDFSTLRSTAGALVCIKEESFTNSHLDFEKDLDRRIRQLCCESARSPRGAAVTLQGTIEAITSTDGRVLSRLTSVVISMFEGSLRSCAWPQQEEIFTSSFYQLRDLFNKQANVKPTDIAIVTEKVNELREQIVSILNEAISSVNQRFDVRAYGSGRALNTLISSFLSGVRVCRDRNKEMTILLNAFMHEALAVAIFLRRDRTQYASEAVRMITDALEASRELLDDTVVIGLERLRVDYDSEPVLAADQWRQMVFSFVNNEKPGLAKQAFEKFNILIKKDEVRLQDTLMRIEAFALRSDELVAFQNGILAESLNACFKVLLEKWRKTLPTDTDWVMKLIKTSAESLEERRIGLWFSRYLVDLSSSLLTSFFESSCQVEIGMEKHIIYDWFIINALAYSFYKTAESSSERNSTNEIIRRLISMGKPRIQPVANELRAEASKNVLKYWNEISIFLHSFDL